MTKLALIVAVLALVLAAGTAYGVSYERYSVVVGNQAAGGDPGVLYVGGPANFTLRDRSGGDRPLELCITPAPIDQPSCRMGRTNPTISGPAFSQPGETTIRFSVSGGDVVERTVVVETGAGARGEPAPYRILAAAATFRRRDAAVVVRLNRALPRRGPERPPLTLGRQIVPNEILPRGQQFYGGTTPTRVGRRERHCYVAEAQQLIPRGYLRAGARFTAAIRRDRRLVTTAPVVLRPGGDAFDYNFLRRAGC
jgi:hypothetical protein